MEHEKKIILGNIREMEQLTSEATMEDIIMPMTGDELKDNAKTIEEKLIYLNLHQAAQFIGSHIWGIKFAMEQLFPPEKTPEDTPFVFESDGKQYITIGKVKYPVELDETRSPGEWYIRGKADDSR